MSAAGDPWTGLKERNHFLKREFATSSSWDREITWWNDPEPQRYAPILKACTPSTLHLGTQSTRMIREEPDQPEKQA